MKNHARTPDGGKRRKRRKGGMPSSLTPEVEKKILELLRKGISRRAAVGAAGASLSSFKRWMQRKDRRGRAFQKAVDVACSSARAEAEEAVFKEDRLAWLRLGPGRSTDPDDPGWTERPATARVEHTGPGGGPIAHGVQVQAHVQVDAVSVVLDPVARRLACELLERHSELDARATLPGGARPVRLEGPVEAGAAPGEAEPPPP